MRFKFLTAFLAALSLAACKSPGAACDDCSAQEATPPDGAAVAANRGGQSATSQPDQYDQGAQHPVTTVARGTGATDVTTGYSADKTQAGAIAVTQAWTADSQAITEALKTAPASVQAAKAYVEQLQILAAGAAPADRAAILDRIESAIKMTATLNADWVAGLANLSPHHDWRGAVLLQLVLSGSATGGKEAVNPENARAAASGVPALVGAAAALKAAPTPPPDPVPAPTPEPGMGP